jgi:DNA invertase Pin-like site-specific DNA recombinase
MSAAIPAAKYRRISDDREGRELGIDRQDEDLDDLAQRRGFTFVADYVDNDIGASSRTRKPRPDFTRMLEDARAGRFKVIAAYTSSRLTRRPREHEDLIELSERYGIRFEYVRSPSFDLNTAAGRRVARILAANDAGESEDIAERVSRARLQQAEQGRFGGGRRPYGHETDGRKRADEARVIRAAAAAVLSGVGLNGIVRDLNDREVPAPQGKVWRRTGLRDLLLQPRMAGLMSHGGEILEGVDALWKPIIPRERWEAVLAVLNSPARRTSPGPTPKHLLSHIAACGHPDHSDDDRYMMKRDWAGVNGSKFPIYCCTRARHLIVAQAPIDVYVEAVTIERLSRPDASQALVPRVEVDTVGLAQEANALRARLSELGDLVETGDMGAAEYRQRKTRLSEQLASVESSLIAASGSTPIADIAGRPDAAEVWNGLSLARKRAILGCLMHITVMPAIRRGRGFDANRIRIDWC